MPITEVSNNITTVSVAIAVIQKENKIFISKRADNVDLAGLWEFPGGKLECNESAEQAMIRECQEEIGITPTTYRPLIELNYQLNNKHIYLTVYKVSDYTGEAVAKEKQKTKWVDTAQLTSIHFPKINAIIINALLLPNKIAITKSCTNNESDYLKQIEANIINNKIILLQFRSPNLNASQRRPLALKIRAICKKHQCEMILNGEIGGDEQALGIDNIHLTSQQLALKTTQQINRFKMVSASCHNESELLMAQNKGCMFAMLSPVKNTKTHPDATALGWNTFSKQVKHINMPVFALGGLITKDVKTAQQNGAQGIAAIGAFYEIS